MRSLVRPFYRALGCWLLLLALLLAPQRSWGAEIQIESPGFTFDSDNHIYRYQEAKVRFGGITLEALDVRVFADTSEVRANGQVRLRENTLFISADKADFNADTSLGTITNARLYDSQSGYYLTAATLRREADGSYTADRCELTACPAFVPGWRISASHINYSTDSFATGTNARLELGDVPIFWFPILAWPTVEKRTSGVLRPSYLQSFSTLERFNLGSQLVVPYFWAIASDQDLTITPEIIERRGNAVELDYRYAFLRGQSGKLRLWGIEERFARIASNENDILPPGEAAQRDRFPSRFMLDWAHNQQLGNSGRLVLSLVDSSDGQVRREYDLVENYRPDFAYQASVTHQAGWGDFGATAEHASEFKAESIYATSASFSDGDNRPALLPRLTYFGALKPREEWPFALQLSSFTAHFVTKNELSGQATLLRPAVVVPLSFGPGLELRTAVARTFMDYDGLYRQKQSVPDPVSNQGFSQSEAQVEMRADFSRAFPRSGGPLQAVKHTVSPRLLFDAVEDAEQPLADRVVRSRVARELITLRLDNTWLGQYPRRTLPPPTVSLQPDVATPGQGNAGGLPLISPSVGELGALNLVQRYNLLLEDTGYRPVGPAIATRQESTPGEPLLPLIVEGTMQLGPIGLSSELHYHHQLKRITESLISMQGNVRPNSSLGIGYTQNEFTYRTPEDVLHPEGTTFSFSGEIPAADQWSVGFNGQLNLAAAAAPLGQRLQQAQVFVDFHPICYRIRFIYQESLELTQQNGRDRFFINRRAAITFDLGGLLQSTSQQVLSSGAGL